MSDYEEFTVALNEVSPNGRDDVLGQYHMDSGNLYALWGRKRTSDTSTNRTPVGCGDGDTYIVDCVPYVKPDTSAKKIEAKDAQIESLIRERTNMLATKAEQIALLNKSMAAKDAEIERLERVVDAAREVSSEDGAVKIAADGSEYSKAAIRYSRIAMSCINALRQAEGK